MASNFNGFYEDLVREFKGYNGHYKEILKYCPDFFMLLCEILKDKNADWHTRLLVNSALAYFVVPEDIISEKELGPIGYIDDVFICAYVLKEIKDKEDSTLLEKNWHRKTNILELVDEVYTKTKKIIKDDYNDILIYSGLKKDTMKVDFKRSKLNKNLNEKLQYENKELKALLVFVTRVIWRNDLSRDPKIGRLKKFLLEQDSYHELELIYKKIFNKKFQGEEDE